VTAIDRSFKSSGRTYGARRVWHDVLAEGLSCGLHRIKRLMRRNGLRARRRVSEFCLRGRTANIGGRDRLVWVEEPGGSALELPAVAAHRAYLEALANWEREFYAAQCLLSQSGH
jgi:transposase InsO family protein